MPIPLRPSSLSSSRSASHTHEQIGTLNGMVSIEGVARQTLRDEDQVKSSLNHMAGLISATHAGMNRVPDYLSLLTVELLEAQLSQIEDLRYV